MESTDAPVELGKESQLLLVIAVGLILLASTILFGNSLIMIAIYRYRRLQTLTNRFVFSLACADFSAGVGIVWQSMFSFNPEWEFERVKCISRLSQIIPSYCSIIHLVIIAVDRYLAILHPLRYHDFMTPKVSWILIAIAWTLAVSLGSVLMGSSHFVPGQSICVMFDITPTTVLVVIFNIVFGALVSVIFYLYTAIFLAARRQIRQIDALEVTNFKQKGATMGKEIKAAKQLVFIVLVFVSTHSPGFFISFLGYVYKKVMPTEQFLLLYKLGLFLIFFNSFMNPLVYAWKSKEFREAFRRIVCRVPVPAGQREDTLSLDDSTNSTNKVLVKAIA